MKERCNAETIIYCAKQWNKLAGAYSADKYLIDELWQELVQAYCSSSRYYHNLSHVRYMLQKLEEHREQISDYDTLQFSIFYHDYIYSIGRSDNEERSADKAADSMCRLEIHSAKVDKCITQILATKAHTASPEPDTNFLTDIDLAILGESWPLYLAYTQQIRKEYAVYPDFMYKRGRRKVLEQFLSMSRIYKTEGLHSRYEEQARMNLREELLQL